MFHPTSKNFNFAETTANPKLHRPFHAICLSDGFIAAASLERSVWTHLLLRALQLRLAVVSGSLPNQLFPWQKLLPVEQLRVNPNGWLSVLLWDRGAMHECSAITIFLCDKHAKAKLAPPIDAPERGLFLQTLGYFSSSVQNAF